MKSKELFLVGVLSFISAVLWSNGTQKPFSIEGPSKTVCVGELFQLHVPGPSTSEYRWEPHALFSNSTIQHPTVSITETTVFRVIRLDLVSNKSDTAYFSVEVKEKTIEIAGSTSVCTNDSTYIHISNEYTQPVWSNGATSRGIWIRQAGVYRVSAYHGCYKIKGELFVSAKNPPVSKIISSNNLELCKGESIELTSFTDDNIEWSNGASSKSIEVSEPGKILLSNKNECGWSSDEIVINVHDVEAAFIPSHYEGIAPLNVHFFNESESNLQYKWEVDGHYFSNEENPNLLLEEGDYRISLTAKNKFGCTDQKVIEHIAVVPSEEYYTNEDLVIFPNSFSPNGDGLNDEFQIQSKQIKDFKLVVFDRWGQEIYAKNGLDASWNGTNQNGEILPAGKYGILYSYKTIGGENVSKLASVQLIR